MGARAAANRAISDCLRRKLPLDAVLDAAVTGLTGRDRGFARAIANETMRRFGQLDALVRHFVPRPPPLHKAGPTLEILLAASCELLFLSVAAHAAVDGANRLAAADAKAVHFKPLINAVLRRIAREGAVVLRGQDEFPLNTADWLWQRWLGVYGEEVTRAVAGVHVQTPPLDLSFRAPPDSVPRDGGINLPGGMIRIAPAGNVESLPGYKDGTFWVQDFAASLPARLFGDVAGRHVVDLCAAPGGKTAQLCASGARVTAVERDEHRIERLQQNLARLDFAAELVLADVRDYRPQAPADCVLLDAPCSATGTVRRHPELPWIKSAADVAACADATVELLEAAASMVRPQGLLVFAVCSLEPEEGTEQVAYFLRRNPKFRRVPIAPQEIFGLAQCLDANGDLRTLPCHFAENGGMDGFYAARLLRL
ncbi:MAG TPA: transcription antitermination factor NusB [Rhizomicrobium sp.]|jgi:16S rRNA (cytosine967-C5)-methyltransferase|nr:transcription antitermination factor NusB [Rhizomicrobium sp.]